MGLFTEAELAEMVRADAEIEKSFKLTATEIRAADRRDQDATMSPEEQARREQRRAKAREYYAKNHEQILARQRAWNAAHREKRKEYSRKNYENHREERLAYQREYVATHRAQITAYERERREKNREKERLYQAEYRRRKKEGAKSESIGGNQAKA